jgi:hypothetical protein
MIQNVTSLKRCKIPRCRRHVFPSEHSDKCSKHRREAWKAKNPLRYFFGMLRRRAKERGKEFSLTFEQYTKFAEETGYDKIVNRGKTATSLTIHRKIDSEGYHAWNIQAVTLSMNARLQFAQIPESYRQQILEEAASMTNFTEGHEC